MSRGWGFTLAFALWMAAIPVGNCQESKLRMQSVELIPPSPTGQVLGQGAVPASAITWPATFVFRNESAGGCTATAIGSRVILTAAHCIPDGATGSISTSALAADVICNHHPNYPANISADFALCRTSEAMARPNQGFEKVSTDRDSFVIGKILVLLGYGCLMENGVDRNFGALFQGDATIDGVPAQDNLYLRTTGGAALCFGDSGGGAFGYLNEGQTIRRLAGVNSRGDISKTSWISATMTDAFQHWARTWSRQYGLQICGLDPSASDCRQ